MRSVTVRRKKSKPVSHNGNQIWETTFAGDQHRAGFLVTGRDINEVVAHVTICGNLDEVRQKALNEARRIAADPCAADGKRMCVKLRDYGRLESPFEMPGWVYGLECRPVGETSGDFVTPNPFCRFRLSRMAMQFNQLRFPDECKELAYHVVGLMEYADCTGLNELEIVAAIDTPLSPDQAQELIGGDDSPNFNDEKIIARLKAMYPMGSESMKSEVRP
jgi:hypothetical protein